MRVNTTSASFVYYCSESRGAYVVGTAFTVAKMMVVFPLALLVLYLGHQKGSFAAMSHTDIFTYNMACSDVIFVLGSGLYLGGRFSGVYEITIVGLYVSASSFPGPVLLHVATCVERYLAVVHPVTYLGLRQSGGTRIRNAVLVCVWLLCIGWTFATSNRSSFPDVEIFSLLGFALTVVSLVSLRVLCVLIRPAPGEAGVNKERADQSKQRAFHTVMAITAALWMWFSGILVSLALNNSDLLSHDDGCMALVCGYWFSLPSNLVLPLLFLHRAGKLAFCSWK